MADDKKPTCPAGDELRAGPDLGNGSRPFVRHTADHKIEMGVMTPVKEGQPILPGAFHLESIPGTDRYKVEGALPASESAKGPAKVNSGAYRDGWDGIFGKRPIAEA